MIEGTKPYRRRASGAAKNSEPPTTTPDVAATSSPVVAPQAAPVTAPQAAPVVEAMRPASTTETETQRSALPREESVGRRDWFRSLVPAFGDGLVKILRTSNNLKRDLRELGTARESRKS